jgi:isopentenyldiphosphate isomerase
MITEQIDIVDENDEVLYQASRGEMYAQELTHRIVHVLIFNNRGEIALQLRHKNKDFCPSCWSTSVGGHVLAGETYEQAALREAKEEIGADLEVELFCKDKYKDITKANLNKFLTVYKAIYEGPFEFEENEVEKIEYFPIKDVKLMVATDRTKFHPELLFILERYF